MVRHKHNILTTIVFLICLSAGMILALKKPLWGDEIYTQVYSIQGSSWKTIVQGKLPEGLNSPGYYLMQKALCSALNYRLGLTWTMPSDGKIADDRSQVLLRLTAIVPMALSIAMIFNFFYRRFSFAAGLLSFVTCCSSYMVLAYGAEGRPYALWFFLTTSQILLLLQQPHSKKNLIGLSIIHICMGLTMIISAVQILIASCLIGVRGVKNFKSHLFLTIIPLALCAIYYYVACTRGVIRPYLLSDPFGLIHEAFGLDKLLLLVIIGILFWILRISISNQGSRLIYLTLGSFLCGLCLLAYVKFNEEHIPGIGILDSRYLIFLSPFQIMASTYLIVSFHRFLWQRHAGFWIVQFSVMTTFFYIVNSLLVYQDIYAKALFAY